MKTRRRVKWKEGSAPTRARLPHPEIVGKPVSPDMVPHLVVGSPWMTSWDFSVMETYGGERYQQHELPYAHPTSWGTMLTKVGSIVIYTGTVRVEEAPPRDPLRVRSTLRHTFLMGGARVMVFMMDGLVPLNVGAMSSVTVV